jgi:F0F1-type ATP synthase assembly protein I
MNVWEQVAFYTGLGFIVPASGAGGFGLGWLLDQKLHTGILLELILAFAGAGMGVVEILRVMARAEKRNDTESSGNGTGAS